MFIIIMSCTVCLHSLHPGYTCFYSDGNFSEFQEVRLSPPVNLSAPQTVLEREYISALSRITSPSGFRITSITLIVNKKLERTYNQKLTQMAAQCGGIAQVQEKYVFHGSSISNYPNIVSSGLGVGGVDQGIIIKNGTSYGYGVYTGGTPATAMSYCAGSNQLLLCLGLKGRNSTVAITDPNSLNNGNTHSHTAGDIIVFFTRQQLLPLYLIQYIPA